MTNRNHFLPVATRIALTATAVVAFAIIAIPALAEEQTGPSSPPAAESQAPDKPTTQASQDSKNPAPPTGTSNDRLFFALPNFLTLENAGQVPPLTAGQKYKVVARSSFDYVEYPWYGALAGMSQAENSEPGYGQGAKGYAKRYGSEFADGTIENFTTGAILPALLHQDPRYFQLGKGGFFRRSWYAVSRIIITRGDSGDKQFNYSEVAGAAIAAGISNAYHPASDRTLGGTASTCSQLMGWDAVTFVVKEFWPDIRRAIRKKRNPGAVPASAE